MTHISSSQLLFLPKFLTFSVCVKYEKLSNVSVAFIIAMGFNN